MVRFFCFQTNIHCPKSKKEVQRSLESISKSLEDFSQDRVNKASGIPSISEFSKGFSDKASSTTILEQVSCSSSPQNFCRFDEMHGNPSPMANMEVHQTEFVRKSQSLGSALDDSLEHNDSGNIYSVDHDAIVQPFDSKNPEINLHNQYEKSWVHESFQGTDEWVHTELFSTFDEARQLEEGNESSSDRLSGERADGSGHSTPGTPPMISKSLSVPNLEFFSPTTSKEGSPSKIQGLPHSRSSEDLHALYESREQLHCHEDSFHAIEDQSRDRSVFGSIDGKCENPSVDEYESYSFVNSAKEWGVSGMDGVELMKRPETDSLCPSLHGLPNKDFRIKRIQDWVNMIDLDSSSPSLKDSSITYFSTDEVKKGPHVPGITTAVKLDVKSAHGMEAAKKYISSMTATSTSAQLANLGLVVIPFLSAFVSLKVLNLSSNAIVRITAGALPRGLHILNLAKNNISTIEGLRELTRLRVLDLSYNRILRTGHGLASCSSLKELYLAGNKISEVEGLHRLLKLNILDLRFNKISTAKCLGQLAANYSSLQAISLEGNPAQRNVGDEQLKKYLQDLLPRLVYFNKLPTKASSSKEIVDRQGRSVASHQSDRGLRSDHKLHRKGNLGAASAKASTSSSHALRGQSISSIRRSKDWHACLPPNAAKESHHRHHVMDGSNKLLGLKPDLSMHRSRSEGNLLGA